MFTDEPSPFRPRRESAAGVLAIACLLAGAFGGHVLSEWRHTRASAISRLPMVPEPALPSAQPPRVRVAPAAALPIKPRVAGLERSTLHLCKAYGGGIFWSSGRCQAQRATIDRIATVPADLPFDQQVANASGQAREAAALYATSTVGVGVPAAIGSGARRPAAAAHAAPEFAGRARLLTRAPSVSPRPVG